MSPPNVSRGCIMIKFTSFILWVCLYWKCTLQWPEKSPEWSSRMVTLLHGSVATIIGGLLCGRPTMERCALKIGPVHYALMIWSWGYFAFDLLWCIYYWPNNWLMLCHHLSALCGISMYMVKPYSGCTFPCALAFLEITNPLLQIRWFLRDKGYDKSTIFFIVEVTYLVLFLGIRGVLGTYLLFKVMKTDRFKIDEKVCSIILYVVSIAFINEIIGFVLYKYKTKLDEFEGFLEEVGVILNDQT